MQNILGLVGPKPKLKSLKSDGQTVNIPLPKLSKHGVTRIDKPSALKIRRLSEIGDCFR